VFKLKLYKVIIILFLLAAAFKLNACAGDSTAGGAAASDDEIKDKIAQMLIMGFRGAEAGEESPIVKTMKTHAIGGVILFNYDVPSKSSPRNITGAAQTAALIASLKKHSKKPLFVSIDLEGGRVNRLKPEYGFAAFPSAQAMGNKNDPAYTMAVSESIAVEISGLGFNVNFAPVADVNINPANPVIGALERSFSGSAEVVAVHAKAFIEGHKKYGILNSLKHFPGHGSSTADSHLGMADVTATYNDAELIPYAELIKTRSMDMVMTAHIINRNIDPLYPATLSSKYIKGILRGRLGFDGIVVSDDMHMAAISAHYGYEDSLVRAVNAGCDMLIISNNNAFFDENACEKAVAAIFTAVKKGAIPYSAIIDSFERIIRLKNKYSIK
jgi:beta-N-acetylhexosaminidase